MAALIDKLFKILNNYAAAFERKRAFNLIVFPRYVLKIGL